jgi:hypothetical protein
MTGTGTLTSLGNVSKNTLLAEEEHKIRVEFTTAAQVYKGQLVKLTAAGLVTPWAKTDLQHLAIGYADSDQASGALVTIVCRGYAMLFGIVAGATNAGPATVNGYDTADTDTYQGGVGYSIWGAATDVTDCVGWILDQVAAANALVRVLVKD